MSPHAPLNLSLYLVPKLSAESSIRKIFFFLQILIFLQYLAYCHMYYNDYRFYIFFKYFFYRVKTNTKCVDLTSAKIIFKPIIFAMFAAAIYPYIGIIILSPGFNPKAYMTHESLKYHCLLKDYFTLNFFLIFLQKFQ